LPIYEYECEVCQHRFEELRPLDSDPSGCPKCGGKIRRTFLSPPSIHYKGAGFYATDSRKDGKVRGESGQLGRKVSETDLSHLEEGVRVDKKGRPHYTPTRPKTPLG